jgi:hypothetical protein
MAREGEEKTMTFLAMDDPAFWSRYPDALEPLVTSGLGAAYFVLGRSNENAPTVIALRMAPNFVLARHAHDCHRFEVVVQGSLDVGERVLKPGDVMFTEPRVAYGPHVAGPDGCITFEFFTNYTASHTTLVEDTYGLIACDITTAAGLQKMQELMQCAARDAAG